MCFWPSGQLALITNPSPVSGEGTAGAAAGGRDSPLKPHSLHMAANAVDSISMFLTPAL